LIPSQAEHFTPAQAEDEDQDEGGIEGLAGVPGGFEEPPGIIDSPGLALAPLSGLTAFRHLDSGDGIPGDRLVVNRAGQGSAERVTRPFGCVRRAFPRSISRLRSVCRAANDLAVRALPSVDQAR
jgi:hypothetical protein